MHRPVDGRQGRKEKALAYLVGLLVPGGGQLYAEDWALGLYLVMLGVSAGLAWEWGQTVVASLMLLVASVGGLLLIPHSLRKDEAETHARRQ